LLHKAAAGETFGILELVTSFEADSKAHGLVCSIFKLIKRSVVIRGTLVWKNIRATLVGWERCFRSSVCVMRVKAMDGMVVRRVSLFNMQWLDKMVIVKGRRVGIIDIRERGRVR
jgi:hypothetical protein